VHYHPCRMSSSSSSKQQHGGNWWITCVGRKPKFVRFYFKQHFGFNSLATLGVGGVRRAPPCTCDFNYSSNRNSVLNLYSWFSQHIREGGGGKP
jgi:hypothetical protein